MMPRWSSAWRSPARSSRWPCWLLRWRPPSSVIRRSQGCSASCLPAAGTALLLCLVFNIDYLIVGRLLGAQALAFYALGFRIPELVIISVFNVVSVVAFPLFSQVRQDTTRLLRGYLFGLRVQ